jgi:hypothetical protein
MTGEADRALAHATNGPALQQNLVCALEVRPNHRGKTHRRDDGRAGP